MHDTQASEMQPRIHDPATTKPTRVVNFTSAIGIILSVVVPLCGSIAFMWKSQIEQNTTTQLQLLNLASSLTELKIEAKATNVQLAEKSKKDAEQDAKLFDVERRLTRGGL